MGNKASSSDKDDELVGFRVKEIKRQSPAARSGLILNSDYILSANGRTLRLMEPAAIADLVKTHENRELSMKVFNEGTCKIRDVVIIPSKDWPGDGLLGVVLKMEKYDPYSRTSTGDFNITFEDVYTKDNPASRRSSATTPASPSPSPAAASPQRGRTEGDGFSGSNTFYQNSAQAGAAKKPGNSSAPAPTLKKSATGGKKRSEETAAF